jgi:hypothetical protein
VISLQTQLKQIEKQRGNSSNKSNTSAAANSSANAVKNSKNQAV